MKKMIPMIAMSALFATTMVAANDVSAQGLNGMFNDSVNKYNPEYQIGSTELQRISINRDIS